MKHHIRLIRTTTTLVWIDQIDHNSRINVH
jgi:hypothetical protein